MRAQAKRRADHADRIGIRFVVGEVLRHKKFGYRGVVIGWDRRPQVDVSDWEGVVGLPSGIKQPFYRVLPDMSDCDEFFGGEMRIASLHLAFTVGTLHIHVHALVCGSPRVVLSIPSPIE